MQYFAYGSNLCVPRLEARKADPKSPRIAVLPDFTLRFNKASADGSTKANLMPEPGGEVWGVVFDISDSMLGGLRSAEGWPKHYTEEKVEVLIGGQLETATTYIAHPNKLTDSGRPYEWYLAHIVKAAAHFGLPRPYLTKLLVIQTTPDLNVDRSEREHAYWN